MRSMKPILQLLSYKVYYFYKFFLAFVVTGPKNGSCSTSAGASAGDCASGRSFAGSSAREYPGVENDFDLAQQHTLRSFLSCL